MAQRRRGMLERWPVELGSASLDVGWPGLAVLRCGWSFATWSYRGPTGYLQRQRDKVAGPYVLRSLLQDVPLSADGTNDDIKINCVEYYDEGFYVGTTASELLHFMRIPADPSDPNGAPAFIFASRLSPAFSEPSGVPNGSRPGVQQILLLPRVGKACILCNWTVTFYSLPELSPVFGTLQVKNCSWIGGVDLNDVGTDGDEPREVTILLSLNRRIQVVRIANEPRVMKHQLQIPLMSISSLDNFQTGGASGEVQNLSAGPDPGLTRSSSSAMTRPLLAPGDPQGHGRSTSLGGFISRRHDRQMGEPEDPVFQEPDSPAPSRSHGPGERSSSQSRANTDKPLPTPPREPGAGLAVQTAGIPPPARVASPKPGSAFLRPHIVSPTPDEFLIVTGTGPLDPGIGMFVNLEGDPTRPTLEFERYPREIVADGGSPDFASSLGFEEEGYVLASMAREFEDGLHHGLEIQRFDVNVGEDEPEKFWLELATNDSNGTSPITPIGIRSLLQSEEMQFREVVERLCQRRFSPFMKNPDTPPMSLKSMDSRTASSMERQSQEKELFDRDLESDEEPLPADWEATRNREGEEFVRGLAKGSSRLAVWAGANIWWAVRNPLLVRLESSLELAAVPDQQSATHSLEVREQLFALLDTIRGRDARTELEFMTLGYVRQKASIMLLARFLDSSEPPFTESETTAMEQNLLDGDLDARVVLALIPALRNEIVVDRIGIWIYGGVKAVVESYISTEEAGPNIQTVGSLTPSVLQFLKRFLTAWRKKKGFGSIPGEIFRTVDASLLLVLLELDQNTPKGQLGKTGSVRKELYNLVDNGVDCFDRAVDLLESYHRLYVLSRLYKHRKMEADVLATWRHIIEGEEDRGGELGDGEQRMSSYLPNISNQALVKEYGIWLANRNPKLGVQVFTDDRGKAPKFDPTQVVAILRAEAPDAVKYYLEHLVFGKGNTAYVSELITYYLDIVINDLQSSPASRATAAASYDAYRALRPPKPTYHQFLTDNAPPDDEVWQSRLRLLQLLGGPHDYDATAIRARIDSSLATLSEHTQETKIEQQQQQELLVPEAIILNGRTRRHEDALRLLVHLLGDYDTAVSYCLRGGSSLSASGPGRRDSIPTRETQTRLFRVLLGEFLAIDDLSNRVEQTGALLERFGGWFDVLEVLSLIPDSWSVDVAAGFLIAALRRIVRERQESRLARSLSGAENLRVNYDLIVKIDEKGPVLDAGS
ncbi:hypothetical protein B0T17DRAFT_503193 [Bombardia bombarda]|uniref:CNH domain-containing protein n=1 Tax=Bombardia bombarda TaxID=252184 RepID=A0AA39XKH3_9PEZI|nr:hypothetical protein B0T17DRAFT_503193 [Bombardia bombarda]